MVLSIAVGLRVLHRGRGTGSEVPRQLVTHLFAHTRAERVQAWTDVGDLAEQHALEAAGFEREGVVRRGPFRGGARHDQVLSAALRPGS